MIKLSQATIDAWNKLTPLNGAGPYENIVDDPNESLESHLDSSGIDVFITEMLDAKEMSDSSYTEEAYDRAKDSFSGSLADLEKDQRILEEALGEFVECMKKDFPTHVKQLEWIY